MRQGFTLIQLSILITVASLVLVATLPATRSTVTGEIATAGKLNTVLGALRQYEALNAYLPCPSDASQPMQSTNFGVAATNASTTSNCSGGTIAANYSDSTNKVAVGGVPVRTLGLSNDYAIDAFGRAITYAVDTNATECFSGTLAGAITVTDNGTANNTVGVLVSHGADGHGAWIPLTGSSGTGVRLNAYSSDSNQLLNAHVNASFVPYSTPLNNFVKTAPTTTFDDILVYKSSLWNLNSAPLDNSAVKVTVTASPSSGVLILNQTLTLTATFTSNVTYSGSAPRIDLTIGGNTRYATYVSGNGTSTFTFAYTLVPSDYSATGIQVLSPIDTNGGTLTSSSGLCVAAGFTPPTTSSLYASAPSGLVQDASSNCPTASNGNACVYYMDTNNSRMLKYNLNASYVTQVGSSGTGSSNFTNPGGVTVGPAGNYYSYIADTGNNRIVRWKNSAQNPSNATAYGSAGTSAGQFSSPMGIVIDATSNCSSGACLWIVDTGNNRVQRCTATVGSCAVVASGTYGGLALSTPTGITVDTASTGCTTVSAPCVYITDSGNNRILKFTGGSTPAYVSAFGTSGAAGTAGNFSNPTGIAVDNLGQCAGSTNCIWISDSNNNQIQRCSTNMSGGTTNCSIVTSIASCSVTPATLNNPTGLVWTGTVIGAIDSGNSRVFVLGSGGACDGAFGTFGSGTSNFNF